MAEATPLPAALTITTTHTASTQAKVALSITTLASDGHDGGVSGYSCDDDGSEDGSDSRMPLSSDIGKLHCEASGPWSSEMRLTKRKVAIPTRLSSSHYNTNEHESDKKRTKQVVHPSPVTKPSTLRRPLPVQPLVPIHPEKLLQQLLSSLGLEFSGFPAIEYCTHLSPTEKQIHDYDFALVNAVRHSDLNTLRKLQAAGRSMLACNKFNESIMHLACRASSYEVIQFILKSGGTTSICDDYGRTPLHDAFWRAEPRFDIITLLLDYDLTLLRLKDVRGATPLGYVRKAHWLQWCSYFVHQRERYWSSHDS